MSKTVNGYGYAPDATADQVTVMRPPRQAPDATAKTILFAHGVTGGSADAMQSSNGLNQHLRALVDAGYVVISADWGGPQNWAGPAAMAKFGWLKALAENTAGPIGTINAIGARVGKVGLFGGSMGGLVMSNVYKRNPTLVAGALLWNPVTDLRWADNEGGYTPAYATGGLVGSWGPSIVSAYPFATAATAPVTINQVAATLNVGSTTGFSASGTITVAGQTVTYTGVTATSFTGCTIASGSMAVGTGWLATQGAGLYANSAGSRVVDEYATYKAKTIKVIHASDDGTVPTAMSTAFVTGVADPGVTLRAPAPTGGHVNSFLNVPVAETVTFFNSLAW